jgi:hypothetical protein
MRFKPIDLPDLIRAVGYLLGRLALVLAALFALWTPYTHVLVWLRRLAQ